MAKTLLVCVACFLVGGCNTLASFNDPINEPEREVVAFQAAGAGQTPAPSVLRLPHPAPRATLQVDGSRGNPKILFFLALSGGGSRAAYFSAATMLKLETVFPGVNLLHEVDVISSVSGGSLPAAYYAISRDEGVTVASIVRQNLPLIGRTRPVSEHLRPWGDDTVRKLMKRDYLIRSTLNWFWPTNLVAYWLTSYDRSDIMAKTLEDNLYDTPLFGDPYTFADLDPRRPFLILNATSATEQIVPDDFSFGSVFTFTQDDFTERLGSDLGRFPIARAVQASAAFPLVYANVSLRDYRRNGDPDCKDGYAHRKDDLCDPPYLHVFDGGNSDNLGLRSIKRVLFSMEGRGELAEYDKIFVLLVDAFTKPKGARRSDFDPRSFFGRLIDPNVSDAVDSLLQANRANLLGEFMSGRLPWASECGVVSVRHLPITLCDRLNERRDTDVLNLRSKLVFYHFSFESAPPELKRKLDLIPTSFGIEEDEARSIDNLVDGVLTARNPCLMKLRAIVGDPKLDAGEARSACRGQPQPLPEQAPAASTGEASVPESK